ncbi:hypothetical protein Tco_0471285 [Tanacetum coccineum]
MKKSQEDEPEKTNTKVEVQSLPHKIKAPFNYQHQLNNNNNTQTTKQQTLPPPSPQNHLKQGISNPRIIIQRIGELERSIADQVDANQALEERLDKQGNRIHQLETQDLSRMIREQIVEYIDKQELDGKIEETVKETVTASVQYAIRAPLRARFKDLPTSDIKGILLQRMLEENYDKGHEDHRMAYEALKKSILRDESKQFDADKVEECKKIKSKQDSPKTPPESPLPPPPHLPPSGASGASGTTGASDSAQDPLPPPQSPTTNPDDQSPGSTAPGSSKTAATTAYTAWTMTTSRFEPSTSSIPEDVFMHEESDFKAQDMVSDDEDIGSRHVPRVNLNQDWFKPLSEDERPASPEPTWSIPSSSLPIGDIRVFIDWFCKKQGIIKLTPEHLEGPAYVVKAFHPDGDRLALSITKMKAAYYPDVGLEEMVPDQMWIEEECMTHMRILSVIRIEVFSIYGYDYMKKIVLRRADNQEYTIAENDFKDLYPSDFEDLYLLNLQGHLNHLPPRDKKILSTAVNLWIRNLVIRQRVEDFQLGIESYQTQLNLTKPRWEATGLEFMHDYKILDSPRAVLFRDKYGMQMLMRFNEIHKFSDGTLQQIDEALDYRVKEFKVNKNNLALNTSSGESSGTWKALLVEEYAKETTDFYGEPNDDIFSVASRTSCVTQAGSHPSMCQTISNIDAHVEGEQFHESKQSRYEFPRSRQSWRDLPRDNSLVSVEVLRYDYKRSNVNKGIVQTEMELVLEHTQKALVMKSR